MKTALKCQDFVGVRVRVQRLSDAKMCYGWVESFDADLIKIDVQECSGLNDRDMCFVEISGVHCALTGNAAVTRTDEKVLTFQTIGELTERRSHEQVRIRRSFEGTIQYQEEKMPILVEDLSSSGLGLYSKIEIERWAMVKVSVSTPYGEVVARAQVRYCRELGSSEWPYRIGLFIQDNESLGEITERLLNA